MKTERKTYVFDVVGEGLEIVASARAKGTWLPVVRDGTVLLTSEYGLAPKLFGYAEKKLKKLASR